MPRGQERAERLAGRAGQGDVDGAVGQPLPAVAPGDLGAEHGADGAVDVADRHRERGGPALLEGVGRPRDQLVVQCLLQPVVLHGRAPPRRAVGQVGHVQDRREVEALRLPVLDGPAGVQRLRLADGLVEAAEAQRGEVLAHLLGDVGEERLDELRLAGELLAQLGVLRRDAHRAGVEVADAHHDAAADDQRRGREAVLLGAQQRGDHDVAPGLELPVGLHDDPVPQAVEEQRLLCLGQPELPGRTGVLEGGQRRGSGAAVVARDEHDVGVRLADSGRDRADADLGDELDVHPRPVVGVLQVVDELGQVLDRVDVVVRRRRDQARRRAWSAGSARSTGRPCGRAAGRPRPAWPPGPS